MKKNTLTHFKLKPKNTMKNYFTFPGLRLKTRLNAEDIIDHVCKSFEITTDEIISPSRIRQIALARQMAMYLIRERIHNYSLNSIGKHFNRDHATVMHSLKAINNQIDTDFTIRLRLKDINKLLNK
jgi:chromosomal replication initiation ATPase DnaA